MNAHAIFVLALIGLALMLFATEWIKLEATALLTLVLLLLGFALFPFQLSDGSSLLPSSLLSVFGNSALIAICALMILGKGVETTKALQPLVGIVSRNWSTRPKLTMLAVLVGAAVSSAFLNNTPVVVVMLPVLISIARKNNERASNLLMPLGLATIIGGMATTIGTSTNLLVVEIAKSVSDIHIGMFDFTYYLLIAGPIGLIYLWLVAPAMLPRRDSGNSVDGKDRVYIATLIINEQSPLADAGTVKELLDRTHRNIVIERVKHGGEVFRMPLPSLALHVGDEIFVRGTPEALHEAEVDLQTPLHTIDSDVLNDPELDAQIMEILITERSELDGRSLQDSGLFEQYGIVPTALHRPKADSTRSKRALNQIRLTTGDIVLCQGSRQQFEHLLSETRLLALTDATEMSFTHRANRALMIIALVVSVAGLGILPVAVSALAGVGLMLATKCIAWRHVGQGISTQIVLVIVVSLALGQALMATGGDAYIASLLARLLSGQEAYVIVPVLMLIMAVITNVVSNNAAAVIGTPIGLQLAEQLSVSPEPIVLAVLFGANLCFATPIGYQTNLLVLSAGGYKFSDFVRVGVPLTLLMWAVLSFLLIQAYGL